MFTKAAAFFLSVFYAVCAAFSCIPAKLWFGKHTYSADDSDASLFRIALIADTHADSDYFHDRNKILRKTVCGIQKTEGLPDALVIAGDLSNASDKKEYAMLKWCLKTFNKIPNVLPAVGNHDTRASETYEEALDYFKDFASGFGIATDKTYYSTEINGYPFIVLGTEGQLRLEAVLSEEQLTWFEKELEKAVQRGKPVFIISHQPLYNMNHVFFDRTAEKNHGIGAQSAKAEEIIRKYVPQSTSPVFFISGHLHRAYDEFTFDDTFCDNLIGVNIPSVSKNGDGGLGMSVEVYPERILLRGINYRTLEYIDDCEYTVGLSPVKP